MNLSEHFTLEEMCRSETGERLGIANKPPAAVIEELKALCANVLEPLRTGLGPVVILSGYRSQVLNRAIGSKDTSQHVLGQAADLYVPGYSHDKVFSWLAANTPFDQIIREFPPNGWVHVSYSVSRQRGNKLLAVRESNRTVYKPYA